MNTDVVCAYCGTSRPDPSWGNYSHACCALPVVWVRKDDSGH